jgi:sigma-B regulation protein RsbU (phosphoserine phosphatase)
MPEISVHAADGSRRRFTMSGERLTIGRSRESDIFLPDQWLSRHHAEIKREGEAYYLLDLGSKNGTLLNDTRIQRPELLRDGDVITLGEHRLGFSLGNIEEEEDAPEPYGTKAYSAKELSGVDTKPVVEAEDIARQSRVLGILSNVTQELLAHRPLAELFETLLDLLFKAVPAERAAILILEGVPPQPVVKAARSRQGAIVSKVSRTIARHVLKERVSLILPNLMEDAEFKSQDSILSSGIRSALCAPLWFTPGGSEGDEVIGLVYVDSLQKSHSFTEEDLKILTLLANVAAAKIENVRLLEESLEMRRLEQDIRMAADIQKGLLPSAPPIVPGYLLVGSNWPCRTVGGDYFDFISHEGQLLLALGDVSGKGTSAALLMTVLRAAVRAHWQDPALAEAVARINRTVCENVPENKYVTFFLARLDPQTSRLRYVNAGHNPPLLVRSDGGVEALEEGGMVLGMFDSVPYADAVVDLRPRDTLLIFSDGITETWNLENEEFGEARLAQVVVAGRSLDPQALQMQLLHELEVYSAGAKATDDRTLIILKRD